jgi:hypothetical protein
MWVIQKKHLERSGDAGCSRGRKYTGGSRFERADSDDGFVQLL